MSAPQQWGGYATSPSTSMYLYFAITAETTNVSDNTSTLSYKLWMQKDSGGNYNLSNGNWYSLKIGSQTIASDVDYGAINTSGWVVQGGDQLVLKTGTVKVEHKDDGTGSVTILASFRNKAGASISEKSMTFTMANIPRASSINSVSNINIGEAPTVKWTPKANSFGYKLKFEVGTWNYTTGAIAPNKTSEHSYNSYTIPVSVAEKITTSATGTGKVTLYSYSTTACTTQIGTSEKNFTITIPETDEFRPTLDSYSVTPSNVFGSYQLANYTTYNISVSATGKYGTSLKYAVEILDPSNVTAYTSANATSTTDTFARGGSYTVNIKVTDGRGFVVSATDSFVLTAYNKPTVTASIVRGTGTGSSFIVDESLGTTARITYEASYTPLTGNALVVKVVKPNGSSQTVSSSPVYLTGYNDDEDYQFTVKVYDSLTSEDIAESTVLTLTKATFPIDLLPNARGIAFGQVAEKENTIETPWDIISNGVSFDRVANHSIKAVSVSFGDTLGSGNGLNLTSTQQTVGYIQFHETGLHLLFWSPRTGSAGMIETKIDTSTTNLQYNPGSYGFNASGYHLYVHNVTVCPTFIYLVNVTDVDEKYYIHIRSSANITLQAGSLAWYRCLCFNAGIFNL